MPSTGIGYLPHIVFRQKMSVQSSFLWNLLPEVCYRIMNIKGIAIHINTYSKIFSIWLFLLFFPFTLHAETFPSYSLFAYSGYLTTPSAYVYDGQLGVHFSYLPKNVSATYRGISDNRIYSVSLGFLPFMEFYFSVFEVPSVKWIYNYGAHKTRSSGVKIKLFNEKKYRPACSIGLFDPKIHKFGQDIGSDNISSTFIVVSKKFDVRETSLSIGYGTDIFKGENSRLRGIFGGIRVVVYKTIFVILDYDSENWSQGISAQWHGFNVTLAAINSREFAYRIGYNINLFHHE